jgi:hypothetical protein
MKKFIAVFEQNGSGCDYTIGCGISVYTIEAESLESAKLQCMDLDINWEKDLLNAEDSDEIEDILHQSSLYRFADPDSETQCKNIMLYEISNTYDMIPEFKNKLKEIKIKVSELEKKQKLEKEKAQYLKLKNKFEG